MCSPVSVSFCDLVRSASPKDHTRIVDRATGSCEQPSGKLAPRCDGFANVGFREAVPDAPALANDRNRRVSPIGPNPGEGLLTEPTPAVRPWSRERVFMPLFSHLTNSTRAPRGGA